MLAWPFRAWAARLDHRRHAASIHDAAAVGIPSAADLHMEWRHEQRDFLHDSFWHWQVASWHQRAYGQHTYMQSPRASHLLPNVS